MVPLLLAVCFVGWACSLEQRDLALGSRDVMPEDCEKLSRVKKNGEHCGFSFVCLSGCCSTSDITLCIEDPGDEN
jgi:hypothetical protein